jgi:membrane-bound metal-dependent hydrolase YbcI (DUF457 family)
MPLPVAHGLMGASVVAALHPNLTLKRDWKVLLLGAFLGVFPDFDYLLSWARFLGRGWHHDFTHSILFAFLMGFLTAAALRKIEFREVMKYGLAMLSHPLLDFLYTHSRGVELFWPFLDARYTVRLMPPIGYDWRRSSVLLMTGDIFRLCAVEFAICGTLLAAVLIVRKHLGKRKRGRFGAAD